MGTKSDMDRIGIFKEMSYHTVGDPYKNPGSFQFNTSAYKGRQMLPGGTKQKSALAHGYMSDFSRVFEGEGYSDPIRTRRQDRLKASSRNLSRSWNPTSLPKLGSGVGSHYGTFSGPVPYFNAFSSSKGKAGPEGKNIMTNPPKKGTGYGYAFVTLNKYPDYKGDTYEKYKDIQKKENEQHKQKVAGKGAFKLNMHPVDFFDTNPYKGGSALTKSEGKTEPIAKPFKPSNPGKKDGGMKAGTFDSFPTYSSEKYEKKSLTRPVQVVNSSGKTFVPNSGPKTTLQTSVLHQNVTRSVNSTNYKSVQGVMSY